MLSIPPKLQQAFDHGNLEPVVYAEITTKVLDAPPSQQTQVAVNVDNSDPRDVQLNYPDPTLISTHLSQGQVNNQWGLMPMVRGGHRTIIGAQHFVLGEDVQQATKLKSATVKITTHTRLGSTERWELKARIYGVNSSGDLLDTAGRVIENDPIPFGVPATNIFTVLPGDFTTSIEFDFSSPYTDKLNPAGKYSILLYADLIPSSVTLTPGFNIRWHGTPNGNNAGDFIRFESLFRGPAFSNLSMSLIIKIFQFDQAPSPTLDIQIDLQGTPIEDGEWSILDRNSVIVDALTGNVQNTDITYHGWAGDVLGAKTVDLGAINKSDPDSLRISNSKVAGSLRQFYTLVATFSATTNGLRSPSFIEANTVFPAVESGVSKKLNVSSAPLPFALPAIKKSPSSPTKLGTRNSISTRGSMSLSLIDLGEEVTRALHEVNIKNLPVDVYFGHRANATSKADFVQIYSGKVFDYTYSEVNPVLEIQDRTKDLKVKIPKSSGGLFDTTQIRRSFKNLELTDVLKQIIEAEAAIPSRYIDQASIDSVALSLKAGDTNSIWITHRVLKKDTNADKEVMQILKLIGAHLVSLEDGRLKMIQYPRSDTSVATWDKNILAANESQPKSIEGSLVNQCLVLFDKDMDGKNSGVLIDLDATAQDDWAPGAEHLVADRIIKTDYLGNETEFNGESIARKISRRVVDTYKNGMIQYKGETGIDQFAVQVGDYVSVTSTAFLKKFEVGMTSKQFMVISKTPNFEKGTISWVLLEVINTNRPPTAAFTASILSGFPNLLVNFTDTSTDSDGTIITREWDFEYDGLNFTVDSTLANPSHTYTSASVGTKIARLRVTDDKGGVAETETLIRILASPVAVIDFTVSAPDQPLFASLSSGAHGVTGAIVKEEWDLSYDGSTFNSEVSGPTVEINLPYQSILVALKVTDEDGLTNQTTLTLTGKTLAPGQVTGFFVSQSSDKIVFNWNTNTEQDVFGYEIRKGTTWNNSVLIASEILTNAFMTVAPLKAGSHNYLVKAINTTGRYSITATSIVIVIIDPRNRNVITSADRKSLGWAGTKTGLVYETAKDQWWIGSTDDLVSSEVGLVSAQTGVLGLRGTRVSGSFEGSPVDLGAIINGNRLSIDVDSEIIPDPVGTSVVTEYSESDDGIAYSAFAQISVGDLGFRFVKERVTLNNDDGASNVSLKSDILSIDVPDVFDSQEDMTVSVGGTTISFLRIFNTTPSILRPTVNITIQNMTATVALYPEITSVTKTGFTIKIRRISDNVDVGGTIDYLAKGF